MKACFLFACVAVLVAATYAADCNPDGNGKPACSGTSSTPYRNFYDPTRYWECSGSEAVAVECPVASGFDPKTSTCVEWSQWRWYEPCEAI